MMDQYLRMKKGLPEDVLLFFRLGDFYEMFFEDAKEASSILGLTLTKRHGIPMCGVPHHSAEGYIGRLVKGGKRVAIAEQTTIPQPGKLVERELTRVISAGTLADMNLLDSSRHNYIVALYKDKKHFGLACVDHTTGEFSVAQFEHMDLLLDELSRINPSELLVSDEQTDCFPGAHPTLYYDGYTFLPSTAIPNLLSHFRVHSLDGTGRIGGTGACTGICGTGVGGTGGFHEDSDADFHCSGGNLCQYCPVCIPPRNRAGHGAVCGGRKSPAGNHSVFRQRQAI